MHPTTRSAFHRTGSASGGPWATRERDVTALHRRFTASCHPRSPARAFRRERSPRARSAATPSGPSGLVRSPGAASSDPTSPSDFCNNHDPWAHPQTSVRPSYVQVAVLSQGSRPVCRVVRPLARPKPSLRPRFASPPGAATSRVPQIP